MPPTDECLVITFNIDFHVRLEPGEDDLTHTEQGFLFDILESAGDAAVNAIRARRKELAAKAASEAPPAP